MLVRIEASSAVPIYRQVLDQIKLQIANGTLRPGDQLPSVRELAHRLTVNQNTVLKVYDRLRQEKIIEVQRGNGTFVAARTQAMPKRQQQAVLGRMADELLTQAYHFQWELDDLQRLLAERAGKFDVGRTGKEGSRR